jgi:CysZ protein
MIGAFSRGVRDASRGARYLAGKPTLWPLVVAPALLALFALVGVGWLVVVWTAPIVDWAVGFLPDIMSGIVGGLLELVLIAVLAFAGYVAFITAATLMAAPFNEMLSEAIECQLAGAPASPFSLPRFVKDIGMGIAHALRRVVSYAITMGLLFVVGVAVPVLGPVAYAAGGAVVTARFTAYDAMDAVWARKSLPYAAKLAYLTRHRARTYGLGAAIAVMLAVPVLNFFAPSIGAAGATLLYLDADGDGTL